MSLSLAKKKILDKSRLVVLSFTLFYIFCYQYVFEPIEGILAILGGLLVVLEILSLRIVSNYKVVFYVLGFIAVSFFWGMFFSYDTNVHMGFAIDILALCAPMICLCGYIGKSDRRLKEILNVISGSVLILSVTFLLNREEVTAYGGMSIGDLNPNVFSCYLMLAVFAQLLLLCCEKSKLKKVIICIAIAVELETQLLLASRRGLVVLVFLLLAFAHTLVFIYYKNKPVYIVLSISLVLIAVGCVLANFSSLTEEFVVFKRFFEKSAGDASRKEYQRIARDLFLENPFFGQGFGCVGMVAGMYSHSLYYELLASTGVFGTVCLIVPNIKRAYSFYIRSKTIPEVEKKMQNRLGTWAVIAMFITGIAVVYIYDANFYILLGLLGALYNVNSKDISQRGTQVDEK